MDETKLVELELYVMGTGPRSTRAIVNLRAVCDHPLARRFRLKVIDIALDPAQARANQLIAVPTLLWQGGDGPQRFVGDMSDTHRLMRGLGIAPDLPDARG